MIINIYYLIRQRNLSDKMDEREKTRVLLEQKLDIEEEALENVKSNIRDVDKKIEEYINREATLMSEHQLRDRKLIEQHKFYTDQIGEVKRKHEILNNEFHEKERYLNEIENKKR